MRKLLLIFVFTLASNGVVLAKPNFVKGARCVACHTEAVGRKSNLGSKAQEMLKEHPDKKCASCHGVSADGKKLTCIDPKACKK